MKPKFVTFTGIDEKTNLGRVEFLSSKYPVEWGILFSSRNTGKYNRYPSLESVGRFLDRGLRLSAHICGNYSNQILELEQAIDITYLLNRNFYRVQINIADGKSDVRSEIFPERGARFADSIGAFKAIIQCTSKFPKSKVVDWLFDVSGGSGVSPTSWENGAEGTDAFCGYAGGIGPNNAKQVVELIEKIQPEYKPYWIDMESNVRTDEWLDLDKCEEVLKQIYGKGIVWL
jgi:hypothetical protein